MPEPAAPVVARRHVQLLVTHDAGNHVLTDAAGALPAVALSFGAGETTATALHGALPAVLGLRLPILDLTIDDTSTEPPGSPLAALAALDEPPAGWEPPAGLRWSSLDTASLDTASLDTASLAPHRAVAARLQRLVGERRGTVAVDPRRAPWGRRGWLAEATTWIDASLAAAGMEAAAAVVPYRVGSLSCVMAVTSGATRCWFKATCAYFGHESGVTAWLADRGHGATPVVVAVDVERAWLLLEDLGVESFAARLDRPEPAIARLAGVQRRFAGRLDELFALGLADRRLPHLVDDLREALARPIAAAVEPADSLRRACLVEHVAAAVAVVEALGLPDTLVHGDFHPGNVHLRDGEPVVIDWSDAAVSHPFVDVATWLWWIDEDGRDTDPSWPGFVAAWTDVVPAEQLDRHRAALCAVAAAFHCVSYVRLTEAMEPDHQPDQLGALGEFLGQLDRLVPPGQGQATP